MLVTLLGIYHQTISGRWDHRIFNTGGWWQAAKNLLIPPTWWKIPLPTWKNPQIHPLSCPTQHEIFISLVSKPKHLLSLSNSCFFFFFYQGFLIQGHWKPGQQGKGGDIYLQPCMWDDYHIFNGINCIYQTATQWDLPPYRITILINWWCGIKCLFVYVIILF